MKNNSKKRSRSENDDDAADGRLLVDDKRIVASGGGSGSGSGIVTAAAAEGIATTAAAGGGGLAAEGGGLAAEGIATAAAAEGIATTAAAGGGGLAAGGVVGISAPAARQAVFSIEAGHVLYRSAGPSSWTFQVHVVPGSPLGCVLASPGAEPQFALFIRAVYAPVAKTSDPSTMFQVHPVFFKRGLGSLTICVTVEGKGRSLPLSRSLSGVHGSQTPSALCLQVTMGDGSVHMVQSESFYVKSKVKSSLSADALESHTSFVTLQGQVQELAQAVNTIKELVQELHTKVTPGATSLASKHRKGMSGR